MKFQIYQWLVPIICGFFIYKTIRQYKKHNKTPLELILWLGFWLLIAVVAIIPNAVTHRLANVFGFKNNVTAMIFVGLGILYLMVYQLFSTVNQIDGKLTDLVRKMAKDTAELEK